ncbi:phage tail tube protein [Gracilimonas sp.]|uniref:phage tail tube protein n=1 Tax=Gracilimonas sp. TaxID=1974203 RepID=UPI002870D2DF|nr:hypothetical protein [Gracilimonas sp.]
MPKWNGTAIIFDLDGSPVANIESATLTINHELSPANDKDTGSWEEYLEEGGYKSYQVTFNGNADYTDSANFKVLFELLNARASVPFTWGPASGGVQLGGDVFTNEVSAEAQDETTATISGTATGQGELTVVAS